MQIAELDIVRRNLLKMLENPGDLSVLSDGRVEQLVMKAETMRTGETEEIILLESEPVRRLCVEIHREVGIQRGTTFHEWWEGRPLEDLVNPVRRLMYTPLLHPVCPCNCGKDKVDALVAMQWLIGVHTIEWLELIGDLHEETMQLLSSLWIVYTYLDRKNKVY